MKNGGIYLGLPAEFRPPQKAALRLADMTKLAEREAYFARIPPQWQNWIRHQATIQIAAEIVDIPTKEERKEALLQAPPAWRDEVRAHVLRLWRVPSTQAMRSQQAAA